MFIFGKKLKPEEVVRKWKTEIRREVRNTERDIQGIEVEEKKAQRSIQDLLKRGDKNSARILALELVRSKKAKERLYNSRATLNSISMQLQAQMSMLRVTGAIQKSGEIMKMMNDAIKLPQINQVIMTMGTEMTKAGLIEEMITDAMSDATEEDEEAADSEVEKILLEVTQGVLNKGQKPPQVVVKQPEPVEEEEEEERGDDALAARLAALRQ